MVLTEEDDRHLRNYAKWLNADLGEDAYHIAIFDAIRYEQRIYIRNTVSYLRVAIKSALYKMYRHEKSERENIQAYIHNDPIPMLKGFIPGDVPHDTCRKGHEWKEETIAYVGSRRTCLICRRESDRKLKCHLRAEKRTIKEVV